MESPRQRIWRDRAESLIGVAAPVLDLVLSAGDRVSRALGPDDTDYYPIRASAEAVELGSARGEGGSRNRSEAVD